MVNTNGLILRLQKYDFFFFPNNYLWKICKSFDSEEKLLTKSIFFLILQLKII